MTLCTEMKVYVRPHELTSYLLMGCPLHFLTSKRQSWRVCKGEAVA